MPTDSEVRRLIQVYKAYNESPDIQAQWSYDNPGNRAILRERERTLAQLLERRGLLPLHGRSVLEVGCGSGAILASLLRLGARTEDLHGIDLLAERIDAAKKRYPGIDFRAANGEQLDFPDAQFNLVLLFTVFSSILDSHMARNVAAEVTRVLKVGGAVIWYDFRYNNPNNPHVRGMNVAAIHTAFPEFDVDLHTITLLPPLARRLGRATPVLYPLLGRVPLLRTHYLGLLIKR
jgi:ubiquinone/menaquinone biosynthesis C-methylase UbiE